LARPEPGIGHANKGKNTYVEKSDTTVVFVGDGVSAVGQDHP
jgi:hypothetical protein